MSLRNTRGFTLIELLIVVGIIGLLSTLAVLALSSAQQRARDTKRLSDLQSVRTAIELYYNDNGSYPDLAAGDTWDEFFSNNLTTYLNALPVDQTNSGSNVYTFVTDGTDYGILAVLEDADNSAFAQDVDGTFGGVGFVGVTSDGSAAANNTSLNCADSANGYCVSN